MSELTFFPRRIEPLLEQALEDSPAVLILGPRQCGKTTLAQYLFAPHYLKWGSQRLSLDASVQRRDYTYFSFDDAGTRSAAINDPTGFIADLPERVILDEAQLVPELFPAIKVAIDRDRMNGRFILTGSSNILLALNLTESLVGRLQTVRLYPLAQLELTGDSANWKSEIDACFLSALFKDGFKSRRTKRLGRLLSERIVAGGLPPARELVNPQRQANWYRNYLDTLVQHHIREETKIRSPQILPSLMRAASSMTAQLYNLSNLARPFQLSRPSIGEYVWLLERYFLLSQLLPWSANHLKRLIKTPKLHVGDTGLAAALLNISPDALYNDKTLLGHFLETFVYQELRKQASWHQMPTEFFHFRDKDGVEVDIVIEGYTGKVAGVEVKASSTVRNRDFRGLRKFARAVGEKFQRGVVLYDGEYTLPFGNRMHAVPIRQLWEKA